MMSKEENNAAMITFSKLGEREKTLHTTKPALFLSGSKQHSQYRAQDASYPLLVLQNTGENNRRTHRKDHPFHPQLIRIVSPRQHGRHRSGRHEQGEFLAPARRLKQDAPAAQETSRAHADSAVNLLPGRRRCAQDMWAQACARETDSVVEEGDEGAQKRRGLGG